MSFRRFVTLHYRCGLFEMKNLKDGVKTGSKEHGFVWVCDPLTILWLSPTQMGVTAQDGFTFNPLATHTLMYSFTSVTDRWLVLQADCGREESCFHDVIADFYSDFYNCRETGAPWDIWRTWDASKLMSYQIPTKTTR